MNLEGIPKTIPIKELDTYYQECLRILKDSSDCNKQFETIRNFQIRFENSEQFREFINEMCFEEMVYDSGKSIIKTHRTVTNLYERLIEEYVKGKL